LQVWLAVSQVDRGQSLFVTHSTQVMLAVSQIGLPPPAQFLLVMHSTQ
jgi:hypothetical protein